MTTNTTKICSRRFGNEYFWSFSEASVQLNKIHQCNTGNKSRMKS